VADARLPQVNMEVSPEVARKLDKLETELRVMKIAKHEIVGVLILKATSNSISPKLLAQYRQQRESAAAKLRKPQATG
jgi:hypothetical protein